MNGALEIVPCKPEGADEVAGVAIRAYRDVYLYLWNDDGSWYINRSFNPNRILEEINNPNSAYFILREKDNPVGFLKLNIDQQLNGFENLSAMELERIYLLKAASRKGFGRRAIEFSFEFAKQKNKDLIWLKSMDSSEALNFYKRLGFVECGSFHLDFELMKPEFREMKILMKRLK